MSDMVLVQSNLGAHCPLDKSMYDMFGVSYFFFSKTRSDLQRKLTLEKQSFLFFQNSYNSQLLTDTEAKLFPKHVLHFLKLTKTRGMV